MAIRTPSARAPTAPGALSRTEARRTITRRDLVASSSAWPGTTAAPTLRDEAPAAYKDIAAVMRAQRDLVRITRRLWPLLSYKAV